MNSQPNKKDEIKQLINTVHQEIYVLNELVYESLAKLNQTMIKIKRHFCPEQFTELKVSMKDLIDELQESWNQKLQKFDKTESFHGGTFGDVSERIKRF